MPIGYGLPGGDPGGGTGGTGAGGPGGAGAGAGAGGGSAAGFGGGGSQVPMLVTPGSQKTTGTSTGIFGIFQTASARVERGPGVPVDPTATITLRPISNSGAANTQNVFVAIGPGDAAKNGNRITLVPTANPITVKVRNLNEIQLFGSVTGEGISIDIQEG
jgi:hypothetical protein